MSRVNNKSNGIVLGSLLSTLNIFHTLRFVPILHLLVYSGGIEWEHRSKTG